MSHPKLITLTVLFIFLCKQSLAQTDSVLHSVQEIPGKYFKQVDKNITRYSSRLTSKTDKTLTKLVRWENKIHDILLRTNPAVAERLFANKELTFSGLQEKIKQGQKITAGYEAQYSDYRNKLSNGLGYIERNKQKADSLLAQRASLLHNKLDTLDTEVQRSEAIAKFIKERKKQLMAQALPYLGKSKYLGKISKESYYYAETLRNYKEIFSNSKKAEEAAMKILSKIPALKSITGGGNPLASVGALSPASYPPAVIIPGLQTRASINGIIQTRVASGGPNAAQLIRAQMSAAQAVLSDLKSKLLKNGSGTGEDDLPDFKLNPQHSKTFAQRLEKGFNIQSAKSSSLLPSVTDIALTLGYKLNDKSVAGIGLSYKLGLGTIQHIRFTHEGVGLRSYIDWKMKKNLFVSGGFEINYMSSFTKIDQLRNMSGWQQSGLVGLMKKLPLKTKFAKETKLQLLYDVLYREHIPVSQPVLFRIGYGF